MNIAELGSDRNLAKYSKYLELAIGSEEICKYLEEGHPSVDDIVDIILYSPSLSLGEKKSALAGALIEIEPEQKLLREKCRNCILYLNRALELLQTEGTFSLESQYFDEEGKQQRGDFEGVFASASDAIEEMSFWEDDTDHWFELNFWDKDDHGKMQEVATYIFVEGKPYYCSLDESELSQVKGFDMESLHQFDMLYMTDLNLPIPFQPGDIVEVGSLPFVPREKILITEVGDNQDCCCIQAMGKSAAGNFESGAVKHGHVGYGRGNCYILPSLLYEMKKYDGPLSGDEKLLNEVSGIISMTRKDENQAKLDAQENKGWR